MKNSKRLISILLSVILAVSCVMPVVALAAQGVFYTVIFVDENGNAIGSEYQVSKGSTIDADKIPALPVSTVEGYDHIDDGDGKHSIYSWDSDPATTPIVTNTVFTRVRTTESHNFDFGKPSFKFREDSKTGLVSEYTCPDCGYVGQLGVKLDFKHISLSQGVPYELTGTAVTGGDSTQMSGYLDVTTVKPVISALEKVGVIPAGTGSTINTILDVVDKVGDVGDEIVERTSTCAKEGHLYGAPTFTWNEEHTECYAHFTCTRDECHDNYDNHVVDKKMLVQGPYYTYADCENDGIETYTATTKFTDTDLGSVDGYAPEHDFETAYEHVWQPRKGHKFTQPASNGDATCTADGTTSMVCENCGEIITNTDAGSALGHAPGAEVKENYVAPTCTQEGSYSSVRYCARCGIEMSRENKVVPATGHFEPDDYVVENRTLPSCTQGGSYDRVKYCTVCGVEIPNSRTTITIDPTEHIPGEEVKENATESTCTDGGSYEAVRYCVNCGQEIEGSRHTVNVEKADHDYQPVTTQPTCTSKGKVEMICSVCGHHYTDHYINQLEHDYEETVVPPTCKSGGYTVYTCTNCGDTYTDDDTAQTDHNWDDGVVTVEPGCETVGIKTYTCKDCSTQRTEEIPKKEHRDVANDIKPTCTKVGYTKITCSNCNRTYIEEGSEKQPLGHKGADPVREHEHAATCTQEGSYESVVYCERCEIELTRTPVVIPVKAHNSDKVYVAPTCTEQGYTMYKCKDCGFEYRATFKNPKDHRTVVDKAVASTCIKTGLTEGSHCPDCGLVYVEQQEVPLADHKWNNGVITLQPTTTETGVKTYTCTVCKKTKTEVIPKITVKEATPSKEQADKAKINKVIKKPADITTLSHLNNGKMDIYFSKVKGAANYRVMFRKQGAKKWNYAWTNGQTHYVLKNLKKDGLYEFKFAAYKKNSAGVWERGDYSQTSYRYYHKANIKSVKAGKKSATVKWARDKAAVGYELFYSTNKDMNKRKRIYIKGNKNLSYTIKGLKKGKKYYIRVRSIKQKGGKNYTSEFSSQKTVKAK